LLESDEKAGRMGRAGFDRVRARFAPGGVVAEREAFYRQVIQRHRDVDLYQNAVSRVPPWLWETVSGDVAEALWLLHRNFDTPRQSGAEIARRLADLVGRYGGPGRYALYGAGAHSEKLLPHRAVWEAAGIEVVRIFDDNADRIKQTLAGVEIAAGALDNTADLDGVILSSDTVENILWEKTKPWRKAGVRVFRLHFTR